MNIRALIEQKPLRERSRRLNVGFTWDVLGHDSQAGEVVLKTLEALARDYEAQGKVLYVEREWDDHAREISYHGIMADRSLEAEAVIQALHRALLSAGLPCSVQTLSGGPFPEFVFVTNRP